MEDTSMRKVEAIIVPHLLEPVRDSLLAHGVQGLSVSEVREGGDAPLRAGYYRGAAYETALHPRLKLEIVVPDEDAMPIACAIVDLARTDRAPAGSVVISPVEDAVRVRTGEHGPAAIYRRIDPMIGPRWVGKPAYAGH
jgi:nitrogen regulatory protein P-II 1